MNALQTFETELRKIGYKSEALIRNYGFADVLSIGDESRQVDLAAFTHVPESYRSAAFGVVSANPTSATRRQNACNVLIFRSRKPKVGTTRPRAGERGRGAQTQIRGGGWAGKFSLSC